MASRIHASFVVFLSYLFPQFFIILQGIAGATDVSNFLRAFLTVSLNSLSSGRRNRFHVIFVRCQDESFLQPTFAFPSAWHFFPLTSITLAIDDLAWMSAAFSLISPRTMYIRQELFSSSRVNCVKPVQGSDKSRKPSIFQ